MLHEMNLKENPFNAIKNGTKTVEMRLYDEKRKKLRVGDQIRFSCNTSQETVVVEVLALHIYPDFKYIYNKFNKVQLGYKLDEPAHPDDMHAYYPLSEQQKYGVVGIEIKKVD